MQTQLEGTLVGSILEREQLTNIRMIYPQSRNSTLESMKNQMIFLPNGKLIPIGSIAKVRIDTGVAELQRENLQSMGVVTARKEGRDIGGIMKDIKSSLDRHISLPSGYHIEYGGEFADQQKTFSDLLIILISACLLVFGVILFISRSFMVALLVLFNAILGAGGCILALYLTHTPLNVGSYTGIIMIVGIIGENAIFTFWQFNTSLETLSPTEAIVYSISTRLRPKLMTAIGAIVALLPLALGIGVGAQLHQPLAISVIGGFIIALPLLLIVFPTLLGLVYRNAVKKI